MARTKAVAAADDANESERTVVHLVEVELLRKYAPHLVYRDGEGENIIDEGGVLVPLENADKSDPYPYQKQLKMIVSEVYDPRYNRQVPRFREIMDDFPAGTVIKLPTEEAHHCLTHNIAKVTARTLIS